MDYIVLSIPIFFLLIGVEVLVSKLSETSLYRLNDAVSNISCGIAQQITGVLSKTILIVGYIYLYENHRWLDIPDNWWTYLLLFIGIDFCYYWFHRLAHEISLLWGTHIVHHQSEEYNLSVALRQSSFQAFISTIFYLPLALVGFNPIAFVAINAFQTLYQFWIHTKTIGKLHPAIEFVFNTPSHHRVHHGRNPKYIDKNHGGTLIIFDRLFGTFQPEEEEVIYGVTKPLASWNPIWANFDWYADLWSDLRQPMSWLERFKVLIKPPGWMPDHLGGPRQPIDISPETATIYDTQIPLALNYYILAQYLLLLLGTSLFLFNVEAFSYSQQLAVGGYLLWGIMNLGVMFELRNWVKHSEILRWIVLVVISLLISDGSMSGYLIIALALISSLWFLKVYRLKKSI